MKDTQTKDSTSLKEPFSSWSDNAADLFNRKTETDAEPFRKAPVPSALRTPEIMSRFTPHPLLAITPEKSLRHLQVENGLRPTEHGNGGRKGRQRVRFAPDTRSPPSKNSSSETETKRVVGCEKQDSLNDVSKTVQDEDSLPRSFQAISQKLYQPGRYADHDDSKGSLPSSSGSEFPSGSSAPKRYTVETQGDKAVYVPIDRSVKNITSEYRYSDKRHENPFTTRIVRHKPAIVCDAHDDEAFRTELREAFEHAPGVETLPHTHPRSHSSSPLHCPSSPQRSRKVSSSRHRPSPASSPTRHCSSPTRSPGRLTPVEDVEFLTSDGDENSIPEVRVIREAPYHPKHNEYVFPFEDGEGDREDYDPSVENPLARPEFNSALKISQELKSVKGKQPDTWGAVSQKLKTCDRKRTEIQEKASSRVNFQMQSGLYSDLVGVDVPLDDLCHSVEKGIRLRAPLPKSSTVKVPIGKEPDPLEFFSPDLQQELLDLSLTGIQPISESLTTANPMLAFDLYRHSRTWNGLTDS